VFDDDHYYMGAVCAELLANNNCSVSLVTPSAYVSEWSLNTLEQGFVHQRLAELGVQLQVNTAVSGIAGGEVEKHCVYTAKVERESVDAIVMVTARLSEDALYQSLLKRTDEWADHDVKSVRVIGDAEAPAPIAWATYAGHRYARELDLPIVQDALPFRRELTQLAD